MRVLILGGDGYLGWPTAMHFSMRGDEVHVVDNYLRRKMHAEAGTDSLTPIAPNLVTRVNAWRELTGRTILATEGDLADWSVVERLFQDWTPDAIIHYGEIPSAPYSMMDRHRAALTQYNNVINTLNVLWAMHDYAPDSHLVKLGTMGEYGTPNIDIEEGWIEIQHGGRSDRMLYPKMPASLYHCSKVHDSTNIEFCCRAWGLRATDLNQGVVYGIETERDPDRPAPDHPVRLRRRARHRAQPVLRAGRDRAPAHPVRQGQPDARVPEHRGHAALRRTGLPCTRPRPVSSGSSTSSPSSSRSTS